MRGKGNEGVASLIETSDGAIGYVAPDFARKLKLNIAVLENKEGKFVKASRETCGAALAIADVPDNLRIFISDPSGAGSYPIATFSWILLRKRYDRETANALREFFQWCLQEGQRYSADLGYVGVPAAIAEKGVAALNGIKAEG